MVAARASTYGATCSHLGQFVNFILIVIIFYSTAASDPVILALQGFNGLKEMKIPEKIEFLKSVAQPTIDQLPRVGNGTYN